MRIYHREILLQEGFDIAKYPKIAHISLSHGHRLFEQEYKKIGQIKCAFCGLKADRWVVEKHKNDLIGNPVLNPYAIKNNILVMMNRDHIIPLSLGGLNVLENLRVSCETCNSDRGNFLTQKDKKFILNNLHLFSLHNFLSSREKMEATIEKNKHIYTKKTKAKMRKSFQNIKKLLTIS